MTVKHGGSITAGTSNCAILSEDLEKSRGHSEIYQGLRFGYRVLKTYLELNCCGETVNKALIKDGIRLGLSFLGKCVFWNRERCQRLGQKRILRLESESLEPSHSQERKHEKARLQEEIFRIIS